MKIIDLLNKIANGEEVPKKIKFLNKIFVTRKNIDNKDYYVTDGNIELMETLTNVSMFNREVEIIEEDKKIEKLDYKYKNMYGRISQHKQSEIDIIDKVNEIIDKINKESE